MKILIVGGAGFIGSHLVEELLSRGYEVGVLVRRETSIWRIKEFLDRGEIDLHFGDSNQYQDLLKSFRGYDVVINTVALLAHPVDGFVYKTNYLSALNIFKAALKHGIGKIVHISAAHVDMSSVFVRKIVDGYKTFDSEYTRGKILAELLSKKFSPKGLKIIIARPTIVFGPKDTKGLTLYIFLAMNGLLPIIFGDPNTKMNPIYVKDLVEGIILAIEKVDESKKLVFSGKTVVSLKDIFSKVIRIAGGIQPIFIKDLKFAMATMKVLRRVLSRLPIKLPIPADPNILTPFYKTAIYSYKKTEKELGWKPKYTFFKGLSETIEWFEEKGLFGILENIIKPKIIAKR